MPGIPDGIGTVKRLKKQLLKMVEELESLLIGMKMGILHLSNILND